MVKEIFEINDLASDYKEELLRKNLWDKEISVPLDRLKVLSLSYYNFKGNLMNNGNLIVFDLLADCALNIFQDLLAEKFPIEKIKLTSDYNGNDELSMEDNNSSCFNSRKIYGTTKISLHSYGMAIDINPLQNPYIVEGKVFPSKGIEYLNRSLDFVGKIEPIVPMITKTLFSIWGGDWKVKDYHHFQVDRELAAKLAHLSFKEGKSLIADYNK